MPPRPPLMLDGPRLAPQSGGAPRQLVILLHGYGSHGDDLIGLAPYWRAVLPDAAFVAPHAPEASAYGDGGRQWWPINSFSVAELAAGATAAAPRLDAFIDAELARHGLDARDLLLVGFSQGTMMALQVGLRRAAPVAGIAGYSGVLTGPETLPHQIRSRPPVLLVHGSADQVVPVQALRVSAEALRAEGVAVETHVSPGLGHSVDPAGLAKGAAFAQRVLLR